jgi:predicted metalloprotease
MRWRGLRRSQNVEDRRGLGSGLGGRGIRLPLIGGGKGIGFVIILVLALIFGGPELVLNLLSGGSGGTDVPSDTSPSQQQRTPGSSSPTDEGEEFVTAILGSTEDVWTGLFEGGAGGYRAPRLVLFENTVESACGLASSATGPFYCPGDQQLYLDLSFFRDLSRMGAPGDFAQAYVIGHEVGHHVQTLSGTAAQVRAIQGESGDERIANRLQVAMELQADCYAGVWAYHANRLMDRALLEPGDMQEGLAAAAAIGDDRLQRNAGRQVSPESFTHGSSAERQRWLETGLGSGDPEACDTFASVAGS